MAERAPNRHRDERVMHIGIDGLLLHGHFSGVEQAIYRLLCELSADPGPHCYTVYVPADFACDGLEHSRFQFRRTRFPGRNKLRRVVWTHSALARRASADGVQLLHGPGYVLPTGWRRASVATIYDLIALKYPEFCTWTNTAYYRAFLPRTIARASALIVPSMAVKRDIVARFPRVEHKLTVAPLGVGDEFWEAVSEEVLQAIRQTYGIPGPYFLCVGNLEPKKNLAATITGFVLAKKRERLPHQLVLAGGKSWRADDVEQAIAAAGTNTVVRVGYVRPQELPALYAGAEALLLWSLAEGFGLPALEAMACGTPVICSDRGALPEIVADAALIVPIGDPEELAAAITELMRNPGLREGLVLRGKYRARQFTWKAHAETVLRVYAEAGAGVG